MEAVDLQAKKMGAQDSVFSTEESLGVNKVVSTSDSKPPKQQKGRKGQASATGVVKMDILAKIKVAQPAKVYVRSVRKWVIMQVYARQNPAMIQQLGTNQVVERKSLERQNTWKKWSRRTWRMMKFQTFFAVKKSGKDGHTLIYVSVMLALSPTWGQGTKRDAGSEEL